MKETLEQIFLRHAVHDMDAGHADKGSTHSYIPVYETLLAPYREAGSILELGLAQGWSLAMWGEYFGKTARISGADISVVFDTAKFQEPRFHILEADATKPEFLNKLGNRTFDIILDDASHMIADQAASFRLLKSRVNPGGLYIIEDILSLESSLPTLRGLHPHCEILDRRHVKGRWDDVLVVYRF